MQKNKLIIMRDLELVQELEAKIVVYSSDREKWDDKLKHKIDSLVKNLFGINFYDTCFKYKFGESDADSDIRYEQYLASFEVNFLKIYEKLEFFRKYGLDFSSEYGTPMECLDVLDRETELAVKGKKGVVPTPEAIQEKAIENKLSREISQFKTKRFSDLSLGKARTLPARQTDSTFHAEASFQRVVLPYRGQKPAQSQPPSRPPTR